MKTLDEAVAALRAVDDVTATAQWKESLLEVVNNVGVKDGIASMLAQSAPQVGEAMMRDMDVAQQAFNLFRLLVAWGVSIGIEMEKP